jgi:hypothetical protein
MKVNNPLHKFAVAQKILTGVVPQFTDLRSIWSRKMKHISTYIQMLIDN